MLDWHQLNSTISSVINMQKDIRKITRIGKSREDGKPRSMKVEFTGENIKRGIFKNLHKLKECRPPLSQVRVQHDMSREEREEETRLYKEAKAMGAQDQGNWSYKVRGPPWARRIAKIKILGGREPNE